MNTKMQATVLWIITVVVTLSSVIYQRKTGPTYPVSGQVVHGDAVIEYHMPRSEDTGVDASFELTGDIRGVGANLEWRRVRSHDDWQSKPLEPTLSALKGTIPTQPPAGKVMYRVYLRFPDGHTAVIEEDPIIIRFKAHVPAAILIPHIFFMFFSMLLSTRTGLAAWVRSDATTRYAWFTLSFFILGGMILGPIVQKYAFDAFWTGWPFGHDLTDNKTLIAVLGWVVAIWRQKAKGNARVWFIAAAVIQILVYLIPHSVLGSELDFTQIEG